MNNPTRSAWGVQGGLIPKAPIALPVTVSWALAATQELDFIKEIEQGVIDFVQCVYIDNRANPNPVLITVQVTGQTILAPATSQGTYPLYGIGGLRLTVSSVAGEVETRLLLLNFPQPYFSWGPQGSGGGVPGSLVSVADVATNNPAVSILAANPSRDNAVIMALAANTAVVRIGDAGIGAAEGIPLQPGQTITLATTAQIFGWSAAAQTVAVLYTAY